MTENFNCTAYLITWGSALPIYFVNVLYRIFLKLSVDDVEVNIIWSNNTVLYFRFGLNDGIKY